MFLLTYFSSQGTRYFGCQFVEVGLHLDLQHLTRAGQTPSSLRAAGRFLQLMEPDLLMMLSSSIKAVPNGSGG